MGACPQRLDADSGTERRSRPRRHRRGERFRRRRALLSLRRAFTPTRWEVGGGTTLSNDDHTLVMGVLNVTPDSFSDGGRFLARDAAIARGKEMAAEGADLVDVGGESTRPGADPVEEAEEIRRVVPVVAALAHGGILVSIDTSKAAVADAAIEAGAAVVNDVTALGDPEMGAVVATHRVGLVLMHMLGTPRTMQADPRYDDVVEDIASFLSARVAVAVDHGIAEDRISVDPGIGFGKTVAHNLDLLTHGVSRLAEMGRPVLVGASRKSFIERILGPIPPVDRDGPSGVAHALAIAAGAAVIRVHNVVEGLRSARTADAIVRAENP